MVDILNIDLPPPSLVGPVLLSAWQVICQAGMLHPLIEHVVPSGKHMFVYLLSKLHRILPLGLAKKKCELKINRIGRLK